MVQHEEADALEARHRAKHGPPVLGMLLDDRVLLLGQLRRLPQDGVGDADLPDVMKDGRRFEVAQAVVIEPEIAADADRPFGETGRVHAGVQILQIEELIHRADHRRTHGQELRLQLLDLDVLRTPGRGREHDGNLLTRTDRRWRVQAAFRDLPRDPDAVAFRVGRLRVADRAGAFGEHRCRARSERRAE